MTVFTISSSTDSTEKRPYTSIFATNILPTILIITILHNMGVSGPSLLIESTDSMIYNHILAIINNYFYLSKV